jgi:aryl-alcohol dehydrogenase-like predicted oxidoreductase
MEYTFLGRSGLKVSRLALGTMNFGPLTEEKEAFRIMDEALDMGINFFDTANMYGSMTQDGYCGWTEEIIGRWFKLGGNRRERVVLSTKLYLPMNDETYGPNDGNGLSAYKIKRNLEDSLRRLQTDHIDLYLMHRAERRTPWEELWGAFEKAVNDGKILYVGSSNFNAYDLGKAQWAADKRGFLGMVVEQHRYNLLARSCEAELLPAAEELGVGIMCWSPLAGGLLGSNGKEKAAGTRRGLGTELKNETYKQLESYSNLCKEIGKSEADVALAWLMAQPIVTCPIMGPRTVENLRASVKSINVKLEKEVLDRLDEIFPKVGPIPEGEILE